jgi:thioredoxin reductase
MITDPKSVTGKSLEITEETQVLVVGAGPAGIAAARHAGAGGARVMLVDENPVPFADMAESVPQIWGGRMGGQVRNRTAMIETMLEARPDLAELFETGIDVRLGAACWGLYANQPNMAWMPDVVAGIFEPGAGNRLVSCGQVIVATGRRDMGLAFPGWDLPGVMGISAAVALSALYRACEARRAVVIGSADDTVLQALRLRAAGVEILAMVEQADRLACSADLRRRAEDAGIAFRTGEVPLGVKSGSDGVTGLILRDGTIGCDSVLLGIGAVPMVDLLHAAGAGVRFDARRSGFVPVLEDGQQSTLSGIRAAGDCTGIWPAKTVDPQVAEAEGRRAAAAALGTLGLSGAEAPEPPVPPEAPDHDISTYRKGWVHATVVEARSEMAVCLCEEVTARDILEIRPPRYLGVGSMGHENRPLREILDAGPPDPDQVKRLTRAGMGPCQGRRCREQVQALLALQDDLALGQIRLAAYRAPVRPLRLSDAPIGEDPAITADWDAWMGIPHQWEGYWRRDPKYTVAIRNRSLETSDD